MKEINAETQSDVSNTLASVVEEMKTWIRHNLHKKLTVKSVSTKAGYSHWYFQRHFKKITGLTLREFIMKTRLDDALDDIIMTRKSFVDIAELHGFGSIHTFIRAIHKFYQMTPGEMRKRGI